MPSPAAPRCTIGQVGFSESARGSSHTWARGERVALGWVDVHRCVEHLHGDLL
jgi:hypothetical protein